MEFWVGTWLHVIPDQKDSAGNDKRIIIKHLCFGPVETQIWYQSKNIIMNIILLRDCRLGICFFIASANLK